MKKESFHAKMEIQNIIFSEGILYDRENCNYRTAKVNEMIDRVCNKIKGLGGNKKGQQLFYELLPCRVGDTGFEPVTPYL